MIINNRQHVVSLPVRVTLLQNEETLETVRRFVSLPVRVTLLQNACSRAIVHRTVSLPVRVTLLQNVNRQAGPIYQFHYQSG